MELWLEIAVSVVGILGVALGGIFAIRWKNACKLLKELGEAFEKTGIALEDKKLTKDEAVSLLKEWKDVFVQIMLLKGK